MCPDDCRGCKKSHTVILCIIPILLTLSLSLSNIQYSLNPGVTLSSFRSNIVWPQYPIILGVVRTWPHFLPLIINHSFKHYAFLRGEYYLHVVVFVVCTSDILNQNFFILNIHYYFAEAFREQKSPCQSNNKNGKFPEIYNCLTTEMKS